MNIAIIPARGGSKRIKNKNVKFFFNKPVIYWSIKAAKQSKLFDKIIVSTDSKKIANICKKYNVEVPFLRPKILSNDKYANQLGTKGYNRILKDFNWDEYARKVYESYKNIN